MTDQGFATLNKMKALWQHVHNFHDEVFVPSYDNIAFSYLQAHAILFYLMRGFGKNRIISVLYKMRKTKQDFEHSFSETFGVSLQDVDSAWPNILQGEQ
jgi:hypothetical protein